MNPATLDGCYQTTRTTSLDTVPDWPALRRITLVNDHIAEQWTAILSNFSKDQVTFDFVVSGTRSGPQGLGHGNEPFISKSRQVQIEPEDWMVHRGWELTHRGLREPFEVRWSVNFICGGQPELIDRNDGTLEYRYVVAAGLKNTTHTVQLRGLPTDVQVVDSLVVYRTRLQPSLTNTLIGLRLYLTKDALEVKLWLRNLVVSKGLSPA